MINFRIEEYRSLIEEHKKNRSYIFERPLIILGTIVVVIQYFQHSTIGQIVSAVLIFVVCFNLWFTAHRLQSDARIVAYIQLVHEGELNDKWFGWESALRQYRIWINHHKGKGDIEKLSLEEINRHAISDGQMFYPPIWLFHLVLVLSICLLTLMKDGQIKINLGFIFMSVATAIFLIYALGTLRPTKLKGNIELERVIWKCVFKELKASANNSENS